MREVFNVSFEIKALEKLFLSHVPCGVIADANSFHHLYYYHNTRNTVSLALLYLDYRSLLFLVFFSPWKK